MSSKMSHGKNTCLIIINSYLKSDNCNGDSCTRQIPPAEKKMNDGIKSRSWNKRNIHNDFFSILELMPIKMVNHGFIWLLLVLCSGPTSLFMVAVIMFLMASKFSYLLDDSKILSN